MRSDDGHGSQLSRVPTATLYNTLLLIWRAADVGAKRLFAAAVFSVLASSAAAAISPLLLKKLVDGVSGGAGGVLTPISAYLVAAYAFSHWFSRSLGELQAVLLGRLDQRLHRTLSASYFQHVVRLPFRRHLKQTTGALSQTLADGLLGFRIMLQHFVNSGLPLVAQFCAMAVVLVLLGHPVFLVILGLAVFLYAVTFWVGGQRIRAPAKEVSNAHIHGSSVFTDTLLNIEAVKCFSGERLVSELYGTALQNAQRCWDRLNTRKMECALVVALIFASSLGVSLYLGMDAVSDGNMSVGDLVLLNAYLIQLIRPIELIGMAFRDFTQGSAFIEKMAAVMEEERECSRFLSCSLPFSEGDLAFENVSLRYEGDRRALSCLSFVIPFGGMLAIVGRSGSGKSSLIRLLMRLVEPTEGRICLGGIPLTDYSLSSLRESVAVVPQDTVLFNASIGYNIAFGREPSTHEEIVNAARTAGLHDFILALPDAYDTEVGERGLRLSGGERQRVAIARAVIRKPKVLVFDEATSSLDGNTEAEVLECLTQLAEGTTTVLITHRLAVAARADSIIVLDRGSMVETGAHDTLVARGSQYAAMWRAQTQYFRHNSYVRATN